MDTALDTHRFHFAFSVTYHYLFPQLTMGLSFLIVILKTMALQTGSPVYNKAAQFWARIFAVNFGFGVVTGIPLAIQLGANWAEFSRFTGGVLGQILAMEGTYAFFLEASFLGLFLFGEKRLSPGMHWLSAALVCLGNWMSGFFITAVNAFMQHPPEGAYDLVLGPNGEATAIHLKSYMALFTNPWFFPQFLHTMNGAVITASFVMGGTGAYYLLSKVHQEQGKLFVKLGVIVGFIASQAAAMPTGDMQAKNVVKYQPITFAAMEGIFETETEDIMGLDVGTGIVLVGQPDMENMRLDNPIEVPGVASFLTYQRWDEEIKGLDAFPDRSLWPDNIPLVYYSYHIMAGLGSLFIAAMGWALFRLVRGKLWDDRRTLWMILLLTPFPYIANLAGWMTAELGRQPWVVYGLLRTDVAHSANVSSGNALFTLLGYMGIYAALTLLFVFLVGREIHLGPGDHSHGEDGGDAEEHAAVETPVGEVPAPPPTHDPDAEPGTEG